MRKRYDDPERTVLCVSLSKNIANNRKKLRLSQEYVAEQLGVSRQAVSKWETGQSEPTARNLGQLAKLFGISVSDLVEPEIVAQENKEKQILRRNLEILAVGAYSGFAILSTVRTDDPGFYIYTAVLIFAAACVMAYHIFRLPAEVRLKTAVKELVYCVLVWGIVTFLPDRIGNVFTSAIVLILCVVYAVYIRFPEYGKKKNGK